MLSNQIKDTIEVFKALTDLCCGRQHKPELNCVDRIETNGPATIVFWTDGTKTVVKRSADCPDSLYNAFTAALAIKVFGSNSQVNKILRTKVKHQQSKPAKVPSVVIDVRGTDGKTVTLEKDRNWSVLYNSVPVTRPKFKIGDRVGLRWPEHEKPDMVEDFSHICLVVIPEDENGMVCVLVGNEQGLKRRDIPAERLERYE